MVVYFWVFKYTFASKGHCVLTDNASALLVLEIEGLLYLTTVFVFKFTVAK